MEGSLRLSSLPCLVSSCKHRSHLFLELSLMSPSIPLDLLLVYIPSHDPDKRKQGTINTVGNKLRKRVRRVDKQMTTPCRSKYRQPPSLSPSSTPHNRLHQVTTDGYPTEDKSFTGAHPHGPNLPRLHPTKPKTKATRTNLLATSHDQITLPRTISTLQTQLFRTFRRPVPLSCRQPHLRFAFLFFFSFIYNPLSFVFRRWTLVGINLLKIAAVRLVKISASIRLGETRRVMVDDGRDFAILVFRCLDLST